MGGTGKRLAAVGVVSGLYLFGIWLSGWEPRRGGEAVFLLIFYLWGAAAAVSFPYSD